VTRLQLAPELAADIARIAEHMLAHEVQDIEARLDLISDALDILMQHPRIGRPAPQGRRELVIGRDARGDVARYRYDELDDLVVVVALRSQREAGFVDR
jgi:toxin ParE1/3/4